MERFWKGCNDMITYFMVFLGWKIGDLFESLMDSILKLR